MRAKLVDQLKIDAEPKYVQIVTEPFVIYTKRGYQPVVEVLERKSKNRYRLFISAKTLTDRLEILKEENGGMFSGLEFWIRKESYEKTAAYILE